MKTLLIAVLLAVPCYGQTQFAGISRFAGAYAEGTNAPNDYDEEESITAIDDPVASASTVTIPGQSPGGSASASAVCSMDDNPGNLGWTVKSKINMATNASIPVPMRGDSHHSRYDATANAYNGALLDCGEHHDDAWRYQAKISFTVDTPVHSSDHYVTSGMANFGQSYVVCYWHYTGKYWKVWGSVIDNQGNQTSINQQWPWTPGQPFYWWIWANHEARGDDVFAVDTETINHSLWIALGMYVKAISPGGPFVQADDCGFETKIVIIDKIYEGQYAVIPQPKGPLMLALASQSLGGWSRR